ncbi:MAG TPA: PqiC family protein [Chthoniobacterales bacterium]|nr:PqiC family protein [Chthoniobacterales bacterium]
MRAKLSFLFCLAAAAGLLGACGGADNYYRLNAIEAAPTGASSGVSVGVGPVVLPAYIDRPEVVFESGPNEFQIPPNALWIGTLQENISRALAADLGAILHSRNVREAGAGDFKPQYRIALDIRRFHGISGREAVLDLSWKIEDGNTRQILARRSETFREPIKGDGYAAVVAAQSRLLEQCARAMAASWPGR